mmetsp:Transcript_8214/g.23507  ORF Transcript_8214/g.23507 Transcript_8214/m.23507 type:complete len:492 (+) Transcript_8214:61-1536(+)
MLVGPPRNSCAWSVLHICDGSVFRVTLLVAIPNGVISALLQMWFPDGSLSLFGEDAGILKQTVIWSSFTFLLGFLVVFKTSQSYARWWEASKSANRMRAEWFEACCTCVTFVSHCKADDGEIQSFKHVLVRLMSLLHARALADFESCDKDGTGTTTEGLSYEYELLSPEDLDDESLDMLSHHQRQVELIYGWVQHHIMKHVQLGVLTTPPPLLTRAFQQMSNGFTEYHTCLMIAEVPIPVAYSRTCEGFLLLHWFMVPIVTSQWATHAFWAALFSFIQIFVLALLNRIATQLEDPFGTDDNDINGQERQREMNRQLSMLLERGVDRSPTLKRLPDGDRPVRSLVSLNNLEQCRSERAQDVAGCVSPSEPPTRGMSMSPDIQLMALHESCQSAIEPNTTVCDESSPSAVSAKDVGGPAGAASDANSGDFVHAKTKQGTGLARSAQELAQTSSSHNGTTSSGCGAGARTGLREAYDPTCEAPLSGEDQQWVPI